jgi:hypothetical protein
MGTLLESAHAVLLLVASFSYFFSSPCVPGMTAAKPAAAVTSPVVYATQQD